MTVNTSPPCGIRTALCTIDDRAEFLTRLRQIAEAHGTRIICFDADRIAGKSHVTLAITLAARAFKEGVNISNTLEMESLLFAAGSRQCNVASEFGIRDGENRLFVACVPETDEVWNGLAALFCFIEYDWDVIGPEKRVELMRLFSISDDEVEAAGGVHRIADLVLERVAMLQVLR